MKKIAKLLILSKLILSLVGCAKDNTTSVHIENKYKDNSLIEKQITDRINIRANLSFPECTDYYISEASLTYPKEKSTISKFFKDEDYTIADKKYLGSEYYDVGYSVYNSEKHLWGSYDGISYLEYGVDNSYNSLLKTPLDNSYYKMHLYIKETANLFSESEIDGFKVKNCKKKAHQLMKKLNITDYYDKNPEIIAMDKINMDKIIETAKIEGDVPSEGYIFIYRRTLEGLPMYDSSYPANVGKSSINGCFCAIEFYKDGHISLEACGVYNIGEKKKVEIISPDSVLDKIEAKYGEIISESDISIDEISLQYLPLKLKTKEINFEIHPAWIIHVRENEKDYIQYYYSAIDAVSGEWIF